MAVVSTSVRIRIGKFEFNERAFKQILAWAEAANKTPKDLVLILANAKPLFWDGTSFLVEDGSIKHVVFPPKFLTTELDLMNVPTLIKLRCDQNDLHEIALSGVPLLTELYCQGNELTELDLSRKLQPLRSSPVQGTGCVTSTSRRFLRWKGLPVAESAHHAPACGQAIQVELRK